MSRSENMRRIRSKDTYLELTVRHLVRELGFTGYRIHRKDLPGKPDIVWIGRKLAIFVHGCFWHGHNCMEGIRKPKSHQEYWIPKIRGNQDRDAANLAALQNAGWKILVIWECESENKSKLSKQIKGFLNS